MTPPVFAGVSALPGTPKLWLLDVWGVLMDGRTVYPGARDCLVRLKARGAPIFLVSNVTDTGEALRERLEGLGFEPELYDGCLTAADHTRDVLARPAWRERLGHRYLHLGESSGAGLLDGLGYAAADGLADAEFLLLTHDIPEARRAELLPRAAAKGLPAVCANPDRIVTRLDGSTVTRAGYLAERYRAEGGHVSYFGKPERGFYDLALSRAHSVCGAVSAEQTAALGDGVDTDVAGAVGAGIPVYLLLREGSLRSGAPAPAGIIRSFVW